MTELPLTGIAISGVGHKLPSNFEDNYSLCRFLDVSPEWIVEKTGIKRRYIAAKDEIASDYASDACLSALAMANIDPADIDLIIVCTFSGEYIFPPVSAKVQHNLNAINAQVFDIQANCAGFVTGLTVGADRMKSDHCVRNALIVGVEFCTRYVDREDVNSAIYLSDGAGAVVLSRVPINYGILASAFLCDSSNYDSVRLRGGGSSFRANNGNATNDHNSMEMNGLATWKQAITHLPSVIRRACSKSGTDVKGIDFIIFHQANLRLIEYLMRKMGLNMQKTYTNVQDIGNTGSASLAIALSEAVSKGMLKNGDIVVLAAVGAGFTFAANVWTWHLQNS